MMKKRESTKVDNTKHKFKSRAPLETVLSIPSIRSRYIIYKVVTTTARLDMTETRESAAIVISISGLYSSSNGEFPYVFIVICQPKNPQTRWRAENRKSRWRFVFPLAEPWPNTPTVTRKCQMNEARSIILRTFQVIKKIIISIEDGIHAPPMNNTIAGLTFLLATVNECSCVIRTCSDTNHSHLV